MVKHKIIQRTLEAIGVKYIFRTDNLITEFLGDYVQKEELLHLHMLFIHVKKYYETLTNDEIPTERYNSLDISPVHIHKNKKCHMEAILILGGEIVSHLKNEPPVDFQPEHISVNTAIES